MKPANYKLDPPTIINRAPPLRAKLYKALQTETDESPNCKTKPPKGHRKARNIGAWGFPESGGVSKGNGHRCCGSEERGSGYFQEAVFPKLEIVLGVTALRDCIKATTLSFPLQVAYQSGVWQS